MPNNPNWAETSWIQDNSSNNETIEIDWSYGGTTTKKTTTDPDKYVFPEKTWVEEKLIPEEVIQKFREATQ